MSRLFINISSLYVIQIANYLLPLITIPYLVRVLNLDGFGLIAFSSALVQYFVVFTEYGFNLTATREISVSRNDVRRISELVSSIFAVKVVLLIISAITLTGILAAIPSYRVNWLLYAVTFGSVIGSVLFPLWLFRGYERMLPITVINLSARILGTIAIFVFVHSEHDVVAAAAAQAIGPMLSGVLGLIAIKWVIPEYRWERPSIITMRETFQDGWHVFVSQVAAMMVNSSNILILGIFHSPKVVGFYAVAEKVIKAANNAQVPVCNAIYPRVSVLFAESHEQALRFLRRVFIWFFPCMLSGSAVLFIFSDQITYLVSGTINEQISLFIKILAIVPTSVFLDNLLGTQILLNIGKRAEFMRTILVSGFLSLLIMLVTVPAYGAVATAWIYLISEVILLIMMFYLVHKSQVISRKGVA